MGTNGSGYEMYGRPSGMTQQQWNNMSQKERDFVKGTRAPSEWTSIYNYLHGAQNQQVIQDQNLGWATQGYYPPQQDMGGGYDDGGYGGGGGGGGYLPPKNLSQSPEWLAYLNALGLEESQYRSDIDRQRAFAQSAAQQQIGQLEPQYAHQRQQVSHSSEAAGMARSGGKLKGLADSRAAQGRDVSNINLGLGQTLSGLESSLAQKLMDLQARRAQQEFSLRASGSYV